MKNLGLMRIIALMFSRSYLGKNPASGKDPGREQDLY